MTGRTVSNRIACRVMQTFEQAGLSPQAFAQRTGISADDLLDPRGRIDGLRHARMIELACAMALDRAMLARISPEHLFQDFPVLGNLCLNAPTLRSAITHFLSYRALIGEFDLLHCRPLPGGLEFEYVAELEPRRGLHALSNFKALATLIRAYDPAGPTLFQAHFVMPTPLFAQDVSEFFGAGARFGQPTNRLLFHADHLDVPAAQYNGMLAPHLLLQARAELERIRGPHSLSASVENLIRELLADADNDLSSESLLRLLCERIHTTRWTLRRKLQQEGTHFRELELKVKTSESRRLLRDTSMSLAQISDQLGFSSQSAFTRFFKASHGMPPLSFRQRMPAARGM